VLATDAGEVTIQISTAAYLSVIPDRWCKFKKNLMGQYDLEGCEPSRSLL
jgi:hypothetical protein